jgi:tetratricopeptide (TPR) repeat protein
VLSSAVYWRLSRRVTLYVTRGRTFVVSVFAIVSIAFIFYILLSELGRKIEIEPIAVPDRLAESGLKPDIISAKLIEDIRLIEKQAAKNWQTKGVISHVSLAGERPDISIPGAGISIASVVSYLGPLLGDRADRISGEITGTGRDIFRVTLRFNGIVLYASQRGVGVNELDQELTAAAESIVGRTEPYVYAEYLYPERTEEAKVIINYIIYNGPESDEDTAKAYNLWGLILHGEGRRDAAIRKYETSISLAEKDGLTDFAAPHINLGNTLYESGRVKDVRDAIVQYQEAIELQPDSADARIRLGNALLKTGKVDAAIDNYLAAVKLEQRNSFAFKGIAEALMGLASSEAPRSAQREGPQPGGPVSRYAVAARLLAGWYATLGRYDEAIEMYDQALSLAPSATAVVNPELAEAYYNNGLQLMAEDRRNDACNAFKKARATMPGEVAYRVIIRDYNHALASAGPSKYAGHAACEDS